MTTYLLEFFRDQNLTFWMDIYGTAVMHRVKSKLKPDAKPELREYNDKDKYPDKVSYCMAIVKPKEEFALIYDELLKQESGDVGKLSDQDFLCNYVYNVGGYVRMEHNVMLFLSWLNHPGIMENKLSEIVQWMVELKKKRRHVRSHQTLETSRNVEGRIYGSSLVQ